MEGCFTLPSIRGRGAAVERLLGKEVGKVGVMALFILICCIMSNDARFILGTEPLSPHICYVTVVLAGFWWGIRGALSSILLMTILTALLLRNLQDTDSQNGIIWAVMVTAVGLMVGVLREQAVRSERVLRGTMDYLDAIISHANTPIIVWKPDGTITLFNDAFEHLTGYASEEVIGKELGMLLPEASRSKTLSLIENTPRKDDPYSLEIPVKCRDGENRLVLWSLTSIHSENSNARVLSIATGLDITEQRKAEEEVRKINQDLERRVEERTTELESARQQLEQLMKQSLQVQKIESVGVLAGGIAHDFNNILTAILGNISLALAYTRPGDKIHERLETAEMASIQAKELVQRLLTFSKGETPIRKRIMIKNVIRDAASIALAGSNVGRELHIPEDLPDVYVDPVQITQVISNIMLNAVQAMPDGGNVFVRAKVVSPGEDGIPQSIRSRYVRISIEDQGAGIPWEDLPKIYEPFFTTKLGGTGLGLAMARTILDKHGGYISVKSKRGEGTTIYVDLPIME